MDLLYPAARWRPLASVDPQPIIGVPRILIFHTMVGNLQGTDTYFRQGGYTGDESTFGVGGPWEGAAWDGIIYQWGPLNRSADAQYSGNHYATSVETADGGHPANPWSDKQLTALVNLAVWWCRQTGHPARLVDDSSGAGFGYHEQFHEWNLNGHTCPGKVRENQLRSTVIPRTQAILNSTPHPQPQPTPTPKPTPHPIAPAWPYSSRDWMGVTSSNPHNHSGYYSKDRPGIMQWQRQMLHRGWKAIGTPDGEFGPKARSVATEFAKQSNVRYRPIAGYGTVDKTLFQFAWTKAVT